MIAHLLNGAEQLARLATKTAPTRTDAVRMLALALGRIAEDAAALDQAAELARLSFESGRRG